MIWLAVTGALIIAGLSWYAFRLSKAVKSRDVKRAKRVAEACDSVLILIGSYFDNQADRSECLLRIRVLLDAHFEDWPRERLTRFEQVSSAILEMPFGEARQKLDQEMRRRYDSKRRQLLQIHEDALNTELYDLRKWF